MHTPSCSHLATVHNTLQVIPNCLMELSTFLQYQCWVDHMHSMYNKSCRSYIFTAFYPVESFPWILFNIWSFGSLHWNDYDEAPISIFRDMFKLLRFKCIYSKLEKLEIHIDWSKRFITTKSCMYVISTLSWTICPGLESLF